MLQQKKNQHNTHLPIAQWLSKQITLPFGRSRWSPRFFVLLDNELLIYKDELTEHLSHTIHLSRISSVSVQKTDCFQLNFVDQERPMVIQCKSEKELNKWTRAVKERMVYPKRKTDSVLLDELSIESHLYRLPTQPLRCTNFESALLERRQKKLEPIRTSSLSTSSSTPSISPNVTPSPTGAIVGTLPIAPQLKRVATAPKEEELSPTYLIYKMKFGL
ncbi:hypothetical protein BY458DRAFT_522858 [Sporodiniella umbellata]|nr:hypothetical protein BY458DRAFT_522858 [Sporodiniella umbellata]